MWEWFIEILFGCVYCSSGLLVKGELGVLEEAFLFDRVHDLDHSRGSGSQPCALEGTTTDRRRCRRCLVRVHLRGQHVVHHGGDGGHFRCHRSAQILLDVEQGLGEEVAERHGVLLLLLLVCVSHGFCGTTAFSGLLF
jgi:hypothetical protein